MFQNEGQYGRILTVIKKSQTSVKSEPSITMKSARAMIYDAKRMSLRYVKRVLVLALSKQLPSSFTSQQLIHTSENVDLHLQQFVDQQ